MWASYLTEPCDHPISARHNNKTTNIHVIDEVIGWLMHPSNLAPTLLGKDIATTKKEDENSMDRAITKAE
jgi:hypothetical protein